MFTFLARGKLNKAHLGEAYSIVYFTSTLQSVLSTLEKLAVKGEVSKMTKTHFQGGEVIDVEVDSQDSQCFSLTSENLHL